jgi:hypothetical protein
VTTSHVIISHFARELSFSEPNVLGFGIAQNECQSFVHGRDIQCRRWRLGSTRDRANGALRNQHVRDQVFEDDQRLLFLNRSLYDEDPVRSKQRATLENRIRSVVGGLGSYLADCQVLRGDRWPQAAASLIAPSYSQCPSHANRGDEFPK